MTTAPEAISRPFPTAQKSDKTIKIIPIQTQQFIVNGLGKPLINKPPNADGIFNFPQTWQTLRITWTITNTTPDTQSQYRNPVPASI
jgi:hypothetical protein